eukprot:CAMPEP_0116578608 /NCGR_PEP_ID=MMETSP0397-20121206/21805_1 /TAXON_ID=216820 /ORGANISM="Cyclophora tenuis, Strain ECT3854" /LENGTH=131 /DNA_ID=CAMNT_0004108025 /DNA_START=89 /DNA_END=481 /DNA_ORIENTATION=+
MNPRRPFIKPICPKPVHTGTINSHHRERQHQRQHQHYDTLVAINVLEHVQNAFEYLEGLHRALRPGGLLIFHERYYRTPLEGDGVLGRNNLYHPVRVTQRVLDIFLQQFELLYWKSGPTTEMVRRGLNETG